MKHPSRNESQPVSRGRKLPRALTQSTTKVPTEALSRKGIQDLQILSESRFLHLVKRLVASSLKKHLSEGLETVRDDPSYLFTIDGESAAEGDVFVLDDDVELADMPGAGAETMRKHLEGRLRDEYQKKWEKLREGQVKALDSIEGRLERLGLAFQSMEDNLSKLGPPPRKLEVTGGDTPAAGRHRNRSLRDELVRSAFEKEPASDAPRHDDSAGIAD